MALDPVTLAAHGTSLDVVPALGGKIASLRMGGREWLWTSDVLPWSGPDETLAADDAASYAELADTGGWDECLPTVAACRVPDGIAGAGGIALPDHGELWTQHAATEQRDERSAGGPSLTTRWRGRRFPYVLARTLTIEPDGALRMQYALESRATTPFPFVWAPQPMLPLTPDTRLELPVAARVRVWSQQGIALGGEGAEHRWPVLRLPGEVIGGPPAYVRERDLTHPARGAAPFACKLFLDLPRAGAGAMRLAVEQQGARLEVEVDPAEVPNVALWLNHGAWTPFAGRAPYRTLCLAPCIGAPDALDAALGRWRGAAWLQPSETRRWTLRWRARRQSATA